MKYYAGIDIGGTNIKMGVVSSIGEVLFESIIETPKEKLEIFEQIKTFIDTCGYKIEALGLSTPGIVGCDGYMQTSGAIKCFFKQNIKEELQAYLHLHVMVENDGKCAALAERWIGAGKDIENFACMTLGTAIGGAVFINGKLHRGLEGLCGEFGIALCERTNEQFFEHSFAYYAATVAGLCRTYSYSVKERVLDAKEIIRRSKQGDEKALAALDEFYTSLAILCMNIAVILAPEVILIGGGISADKEVMEHVNNRYKEMCENYHVLSLVKMPEIRTCKLLNQAGMIGAVYALLEKEGTLS